MKELKGFFLFYVLTGFVKATTFSISFNLLRLTGSKSALKLSAAWNQDQNNCNGQSQHTQTNPMNH